MRLRYAFGVTLAAQALSFALAGAMQVLLARLLGTSGRGEYAVLLSVTVILAQVLPFGLHWALPYQVSKADLSRSEIVSLVGAVSVLGGGMAAVVFHLGAGWGGNPAPLALPLVSLGVCGFIWYQTMTAVASVRERFVHAGLAQVAFRGMPLVLLSGWVLAAAGVTVEQAFGLSMMGVWCGALIAIPAAAPREVPSVPGTLRRALPELGRVGARSTLANGLLYLLMRVDVPIVASILGTRSAGLYAAGVGIAELAFGASTAVGSVVFSRAARRSPAESRRVTLLALGTVAVAGTVVGVVTIMVAPWLVPWLFGREFADAVPVVRLLVPGIVFGSLAHILHAHISASGYPRVLAYAAGLGLAIDLTLLVTWLDGRGPAFASIACSCAYAARFGVLLAAFLRSRETPVSDEDASG